MRQPNLHAPSIALAIAITVLVTGCQAPTQPAAAPAAPLTPPPPKFADEVVVLKGQRLLELMHDGKAFETFSIALSDHSTGTKHQLGDGRTPEGHYAIDGRTMHTKWSRELHISYPDTKDRARAAAAHVNPGGGIFIHAMPADYGPYDPPLWVKDWTEGCVAVGNAAIVKIWDAVPDGTPIDIRP
jgi:murein L,D-transpeptidase YafK